VNKFTNADIRKIAVAQLAKNLGCTAEDLETPENKTVVCKPVGNEGYHFFEMVCYRNATVISVDECLKNFAEAFIEGETAFRCFEKVDILTRELHKHNKIIDVGTDYYLPDMTKIKPPKADFDIVILHGRDVETLYEDKRFGHALDYVAESETKHDVLAVAGYINNSIIGVAAASNNYETMWAVGIDVLPEHRNKGVAAVLTSVITNEVLKKGIVPYWYCGWSNIASRNTAINSGYKSAWVTIGVEDC